MNDAYGGTQVSDPEMRKGVSKERDAIVGAEYGGQDLSRLHPVKVLFPLLTALDFSPSIIVFLQYFPAHVHPT